MVSQIRHRLLVNFIISTSRKNRTFYSRMANPFFDSSDASETDKKQRLHGDCYFYPDGSINWAHCSYRFLATCVLIFVLYLCWCISPFSGNWSVHPRTDRLAISHDIYAECEIHSLSARVKELIESPAISDISKDTRNAASHRKSSTSHQSPTATSGAFDVLTVPIEPLYSKQ